MADDLVRAVRVAQFNRSTVRVVVDLTRPAAIRPIATGADRQVFAIEPRERSTTPVVQADASQPPPPPPSLIGTLADIAPSARPAAAPVLATAGARLPRPTPKRPTFPPDTLKVVVALDPGHGGHDPGAKGTAGSLEKDLTLAVARQMRRQLEDTGRYRVILTRDRDQAVRLSERIARARAGGAQLLLSIHADALSSREPSGASVYTLADTPSDPEADWLARHAEILDPADAAADADPDVARILADLAHRDMSARSASFASLAVRELGREIPVSARPHRQAGFAVLRAPDIPSVLIELGFLSNPRDEANLARAAVRTAIAAALVRAVENYFARAVAGS